MFVLSFRCKAWCIFINFLVLWSLCLSLPSVQFKKDPDNLFKGTSKIFIPFDEIFCCKVWFREVSLVFWETRFLLFLIFPLYYNCCCCFHFKIFLLFVLFFFSKCSDDSLVGLLYSFHYFSPFGLGCWIHWLHLCRGGKTPPTLNNLMVSLQLWWFGVPLHCHCSQVHSDPEWWQPIELYGSNRITNVCRQKLMLNYDCYIALLETI